MKILNSLLVLIVLVISLGSCKKYNQIDNGSTVKTPYTLFIGGYNGTLKKTNDALYFSSLFYTDNSTVRQILVADTMVCYIKDNFYYSKDDGKFFQLSNSKVTKQIDSFYKYYIPNISLYDESNKRIYLCTNNDYIEYSTDGGRTFQQDLNWVVPAQTLKPTSITQLKNNHLFMMRDTTLFKQIGTAGWDRVYVDTPFTLPSNSTNWYISHTSDTLMAIDFKGTDGIYYSTDEGKKWYACKQLPKTQEILFGNQVLGEFYVGLDSAGLYKFSGNKFRPVGKGIPWYAKVSSVVSKTVRYRTDYTRDYLFCATDQGLYVSESYEKGEDWHLILPGQYCTLR